MIIFEDTRNQMGKHDLKHEYFERNGIEIRRTKLYVGDYTLPFNQTICIDTKNSIQELIGDVQSDHERFRSEQNRAQEAGIKLIVLVENEHGYRCVDDVVGWINPNCRKTSRSIEGPRLATAMKTMAERYGVRFEFCSPEEAGKRILQLLEVKDGRK